MIAGRFSDCQHWNFKFVLHIKQKIRVSSIHSYCCYTNYTTLLSDHKHHRVWLDCATKKTHTLSIQASNLLALGNVGCSYTLKTFFFTLIGIIAKNAGQLFTLACDLIRCGIYVHLLKKTCEHKCTTKKSCPALVFLNSSLVSGTCLLLGDDYLLSVWRCFLLLLFCS